jgi:putative ABC transport system permease protein
VDSLEKNIRNSVNALGDGVIYVQKWPWGSGGEYAWWKYFQRPQPKMKESEAIAERSRYADAVAYGASIESVAKYLNNTVENVGVAGFGHDYHLIWDLNLSEGRYFTPQESQRGSALALLGSDIADGLFEGRSAIGREIQILGRSVQVIGVIEKQGESIVGSSNDELVIVPIEFLRKMMRVDGDRTNPLIMVKAKEGVEVDQLKDELRGIMRGQRRLSPREEDDFALNEISVLSNGLSQMFGIINIAGWIIGGFSVLVGGFGIANIMFVSVKERTNQIGIQKSLGAKNRFILTQFLSESIFLCIIGAVIGLILVAILGWFATRATEFEFYLSLSNIVTGLIIAIVVGLVSGVAPASSAARLNPVDAIRTGH